MLPFRWYQKALPIWVRTLNFVLILPLAAIALIPYLLLSMDSEWGRLELGPARYLGFVFIVGGLLLWVRCLWEFAARGRGTPSPLDPPQKLVVSGLYRFVRNPMYVTVGIILIGEALLFESAVLLAYPLVLCSVFHLFVVLYEEPTLRSMFGKSYDEYCRKVPRWVPWPPRLRKQD